MASRTVPTCDVRLDSVSFPAPQAGDFVELILLRLSSGVTYVVVSRRQMHVMVIL